MSRRRRRVDGLTGSSPAIGRVREFIQKAAKSDATLLITGESGTGKELVARAVHARGARRERPFVTVNCGAIPANLIESELFGHVKGAFTGAVSDRAGLFRMADGGTILLDEIGDLPLPLQVKLLRVLQERTFTPVGADNHVTVDVRVIAATNRDLTEEVRAKRFREDLFYRLNVLAVELPPCASADRIFLRWYAGSCGSLLIFTASVSSGFRSQPLDACNSTITRATCASWRTSSSTPSRSVMEKRCMSSTFLSMCSLPSLDNGWRQRSRLRPGACRVASSHSSGNRQLGRKPRGLRAEDPATCAQRGWRREEARRGASRYQLPFVPPSPAEIWAWRMLR